MSPGELTHQLELELARVRSEATAARWEARAAELELLLCRARGPAPSEIGASEIGASEIGASEIGASEIGASEIGASEIGASEIGASEIGASEIGASAAAAPQPLGDWQPLVLAAQRRRAATPAAAAAHAVATAEVAGQSSHAAGPRTTAAGLSTVGLRAGRGRKAAGGAQASLRPARPAAGQRRPSPQAMPVTQLQPLTVEQPAPPQRRRRPAAWICSVAAHLLVLLLLAMMTIAHQVPKDQIALAASAASDDSPALQTLQIAAADAAAPAQQPAPRDVAAVVSPLGDLAAVPAVALDLPQVAAPSSALAAALSPASGLGEFASASPQQLTTQFFGVQGGGNHFCYVVDSSLSMSGGRFEGARAELLRSIDQLSAEQRFYVMFYSANLDRMQVDQAGQPDAYSVMATPENKRAVRRWAMGVGLQPGGPPDDALRFALQLRPDVIFLLSDGEFPQRIEDLVSELNRSDNLFGDSGPRTILHTIAYQSRDGETRMRRLAEANGGQYRYVPGRK